MAMAADRSALRQVLDNLLSNAVKFSLPNRDFGQGRAEWQYHRVHVHDQWPGFTSEDKDGCFDATRVLGAADGGEPTGLGLSIVKTGEGCAAS